MTMQWDTSNSIGACTREAYRVLDAAEFLTDVERDTFSRLLLMIPWIMHDRFFDRLPEFSEEALQPLRDWMRAVGAERRWRGAIGLVLPSFNVTTAAEQTDNIFRLYGGPDEPRP